MREPKDLLEPREKAWQEYLDSKNRDPLKDAFLWGWDKRTRYYVNGEIDLSVLIDVLPEFLANYRELLEGLNINDKWHKGIISKMMAALEALKGGGK